MPVHKQDLRRLSEQVWEIPLSFNPRMQVPVHVYADDRLIEAALGDESLQQAVNVACLPGLVGQVVVMPDVHQGYGMPIGGVMASRVPSGVISPGAIGYDINCLTGDARVLHPFGYHRPIDSLRVDWVDSQVVAQTMASRAPAPARLVRFIHQAARQPVLLARTEAGYTVRATADHPFWTPAGMVPLGDLTPGQWVALYPFEGVAYEAPDDAVLVDGEAIRQVLLRAGRSLGGNVIEQISAHLECRSLLPLRRNSSKLPYLIRLAGMLFGDGHLSFTGSQQQGQAAFYGKAEDLAAIQRDISALGFASVGHRRERSHQVKTTYKVYTFDGTEHSVHVQSSALAALLAALGVPMGNKARQAYSLPAWLWAAPRWHQRLFLAAFFGAELSKPGTVTGHGYNFGAPTVSMNKRAAWVASGCAFLSDVARLLAGFGVDTTPVGQRREQANGDGSYSHRLRLGVLSRPDNLLRLWTTIGFEYQRDRQATANAAAVYLQRKQQVVDKRAVVADQAEALAALGWPKRDIVARLAGPDANPRFIERSLYEGRKTAPRVRFDFPSFAEFQAEVTAGLGNSGMVWDRLASREPVPYDGDVYDLTVDHPDHNFVADGFVVSNCGVRLLSSALEHEAAEPHLPELADALYRNCPSGVGQKGSVPLTVAELDKVCREGARWALREGYARAADLECTEEFGRLEGAEPSGVSSRAKERGRSQLGTLGAGNHFIEVDVVDQIFDAEAARVLGLAEGRLAVQIHCGSRGFGHQVCTDFVQAFQGAAKRYGIWLPDRELVCAPLDSPEGQSYLGAMKAAANFAFCNRQVLAHHVRRSFEQALAGKVDVWDLHQVYDIAHNMGKIETHAVGGQMIKVCVHRKGATRAFGPGFEGLPAEYQPLGQPVLVPGSMGTASWVLLGTAGSMAQTFGSTCHGAGRVMSRSRAKREVRGDALRRSLEAEGVRVRAGSLPGLAEEAPQAYKDVDRVIEVVTRAGIAKRVARLRPVAVVKG
ncbi:MAG: RtcB family protein [Anaerolineales bacterium]|nr:RtcB family protein [Anaerolineales bacterium]